MSTQRFRLKAAVIATTRLPERVQLVYLPEGAEILAIDPVPGDTSDSPNRQVCVEWDHQVFSAFAVDIQERGEALMGA